ncbi:site-specific integrase [Actinomadura sp. 21ATH]|uniref:site-specific integrase n=1 Tax=Actinomadura sp. 21ATH TaxID=1735444 RepID=UPI0035BFEB93
MPAHRPRPPVLRTRRVPVQAGHPAARPPPTRCTLHQLRHSRLTHLAEDGWSAPMLMALSGHENIRSLAIYTNVTAEVVGAALAQQDPARRHR